MGFRRRLTVFLMTTLVLVQALTAAAVYSFTRSTLVEQGKAQLADAAGLFVRQLDEIGVQVSADVQVLALDFALRQAIAQRELPTVLSALRNHGRRVGAARVMQVGLDGMIDVDTADPEGHAPTRLFAFPELIDAAAVNGRGASVVAIDGLASWLVVVPVKAPVPIAYIAVYLPLDDALLGKLQKLAALPKAIELAFDDHGAWHPVAGTAAGLLADLPKPGAVLAGTTGPDTSTPDTSTPDTSTNVLQQKDELVLAVPLATPADSTRVVAVLGYSIDEALQQYRLLMFVIVVLLALGLVVALAGAMLIARGVARPVEELAAATRRIESGDYSPPPLLPQEDEIGQLSQALGSMALAISEREERIRYQASHDPVTGLLNRAAFEVAMAPFLAPAHVRGALLSVGLARHQQIVNTVGREIADRVLRDAGARLSNLLAAAGRDVPLGVVGDRSFALFMPGLDAEGAHQWAERIAQHFDRPYLEGDLTIDSAAAVGIALAPIHGATDSELLLHGDVALLSALGSENHVAIYDPATDPHRPEHLSLMSDLREALDQNALQLFYQPKLDLAVGRISGAEALIRWRHPKRGFVPPDAFITLAEETGNIQRLTRWVLEAGIGQVAAWRKMGLALRLSINLSVRDLADESLPERIGALMAAYDVPADYLVLEVTESAIMGKPDAAIAVLRRLANQGIALSVDDFGVGQSSLNYLRRLPVSELKIDKSFVLKLAETPDDRTIVQSVVELGHRLGYSVTAEGIEDEASLALLSNYGCDYGQGYHIGKPMPAEVFNRFLSDARWRGKRLQEAS
ncbi:hypothetical protein GCM10011611_31280 [Aliidongia dinghuensis]|uniref:EAL domain-containing protein n=1 Tax=Aliidongia dinghuensis TaxID=1867774 RepID=A0A8J2YUA6_9PROT|nr:EAL domain-containing protein [Aliidongia dinghuensis]GGF22928.1 hypothetical protein GCM10011611_31280 [Aliidongia dinghuensis]